MPVRYNSQIEEHHTVRKSVGVFDVSHMGQVVITGADPAKSIEKFLSKQRLAVLRLDIHYQIKREHLADTLLKDVSMHYAFLKGNPVVDYVLGVQWAMYELIHEGYCTYAQFDRLSGFMNDISQLREQELWMNFSLGRYEDQMTRFYRDLVAIKFPSIVAQYDELNMDIRNIQNSRYVSEKKEMTVAGAFAHLITKVPDSLRAQLDTMELVFDMICVNLHGFNGGMPSEGLLDAACVRLKNHAIKMNLPEAFNFRIAKLYVEVNRDMHAYNLLTWMLLNGAGNDETKALFLKMGYFHSQEFHSRVYHQQLLDFYPKMEERNWCEMFIGDCNISFQVFDDEVLRDFYCKTCQQYYNYAKHPEDWIAP